MQFTAEQIFTLAATAHRINSGYFKDSQWSSDGQCMIREANKQMIKRWVREGYCGEETDEDRSAGQLVRDHFRAYMFLAIAGQLNDFQQQAYRLSQKESFTARDSLELAIVSCLPLIRERDLSRKEFMQQLRNSPQLRGAKGDRVEGEFVVTGTRYNLNFNKYKVSGKMGGSFVDFWFGEAPAVGSAMQIRGKIKAQCEDNSTQLNYVKIIG